MVDGREIAKSKAEERKQKLVGIRYRRRKQLLVVFMALLVLSLGAHQLYRSGLFSIKTIDISGNKFVPKVKIEEACGISEDSNLLSISIKKLKEKILKDPWVKSVSIKRKLPGTLRIEIDERIPVALLSHGGKFYLIDEDLFVITERQYADDIGVPTITDLAIEKIKVGNRLTSDSLVNAIKCLKSLEPSFKETINLVSASSVDKLSLYNKDNLEILYGEAKRAEEKNKVLKTILREQGKQVIFIDIRNFPQSDPVLKRIDTAP